STRRALGVSGIEDRPKVAVIPGYAECELIEVCFAEDHGVLSSKALHDSGIAVRNVLAEYLRSICRAHVCRIDEVLDRRRLTGQPAGSTGIGRLAQHGIGIQFNENAQV